MIGKVKTGKSFRGCLLYCLQDKIPRLENEVVMKDRAEVIYYNQCYGNAKELIEQFNDVRKLNEKLGKPVMHISISLAPGEVLTADKLTDMSIQCAKDFGFEKNQYVAILHKDADHQHLHIVANRVGFDKQTVKDNHSYKTMAQVCRKLELRHELKQVLSPRLYLSEKDRLVPRLDERKLQLRNDLTAELKHSRSLQDFERRMKEKGYQVAIGRGISFTDSKNVKVKGSELNYSLKTIEYILAKQQKLEQRQVQSQRHELKDRKMNLPKDREERGFPGLGRAADHLASNLEHFLRHDEMHGGPPSENRSETEEERRRRKRQHLDLSND